MFDLIIITLLLIGYVVIFLILVLVCLAPFNWLKYRHVKFNSSFEPTFSLIVPAHNEEEVIGRTIELFLATDYPVDKKEIIVVNDGSKDHTAQVVAQYASKIVDSETGITKTFESKFGNVTLVNRKVGGKGKAYVANDGNRFASGTILFFIDADVRVSQDVFRRAARHFKDPKVGAVAGFVDVHSKKQWLNKFVDFESVTAQKISRQGFDTLGIHYVIPGGCAIFRKNVVDEIGGYQHDTLAEDTDITWRIATETDVQIRFDASIVVVADEPTSLTGLWNQRVRWARGNLGVTFKHKNKIGKAKYHKAATIGYPFWVTNVIAPLTFIFSSAGLVLAALFNVETFVVTDAWFLSFSFFFILVTGIIANRGKSWLGGLLAPGVPLLIVLCSGLINSRGVIGIVESLGYGSYAGLFGVLFIFWLFFCVVGTWISLKLSKKHAKLADFLQLGLFGYWILLVSCVLYGYYKELHRDDMVWIRTER